MSSEALDKIAKAVLYEGYILYPYRPSVKNRQRWTIGGVYPRSFSESQRNSSDAWFLQVEIPIVARADAAVEPGVRFLHLTARSVGALPEPADEWPIDRDLPFRPIESLDVEGRQFQSWQEAVERDVQLGGFELDALIDQPASRKFAFSASRATEPLPRGDGRFVGVLVREQQAIRGRVELSARRLSEGVCILTVRVENETPMSGDALTNRDEALLRSLVSAHVALRVNGGEFVSVTDPPAALRSAADACQNVGCWPVLIGQEGDTDVVLASPIILSDHPRIAPESPGDLFDGTEIDEILSLRVLTLTDDEKRQIAGTDERARELLARTEALALEQLMGLHGTMRHPRPTEQHHV